MSQSADQQQLMTARILWGALTFSILIYSIVLSVLGKLVTVTLPTGELTPIQYVALGANALAIVTYLLHKQLVLSQREMQQRLPGYITCWAMNESIAIFGFVAVFLSEEGNGFFYVANAMVAVTGNLLTFPKKEN